MPKSQREITDELWAELVPRLIRPSETDTMDAAVAAARHERRLTQLVTIDVDDGTVTLWGERADKYYAVARALARESRIWRIASAQGVAKVLKTAVGRVLVDHGLGRGREPHLYLNDVRATLEHGVLDWTVVVAVAGVAVSGLAVLGLGNTKVFSLESEEARRLAGQLEAVVAEMHPGLTPDRLLEHVSSYTRVFSEDNVFKTCAATEVRACDATHAVALGLDAILEVLTTLEVFRLLCDRKAFPLPIGLPHEFGPTIAPAVAFAKSEVAEHRIDMRVGYSYPLKDPLDRAFVVDPRVFEDMRERGWDKLAAIWAETDEEPGRRGGTDKRKIGWKKKLRSAAHWLGLGMGERTDAIAFVNFSTVLEALLLDKEETERIATTLAERLAFVLSNQSSQRLAVFRDAKRLYSIRSDIVHDGITEVPDDDLKTIRWLGLACFLTLLNDMPEIERFQDLVGFCQRGKFEAGVELDAGDAKPAPRD